MAKWSEFAEAFSIFAKYGDKDYHTYAEHDIIYAGPDPKEVSGEDQIRLKELGWSIDEGNNSWYKFT